MFLFKFLLYLTIILLYSCFIFFVTDVQVVSRVRFFKKVNYFLTVNSEALLRACLYMRNAPVYHFLSPVSFAFTGLNRNMPRVKENQNMEDVTFPWLRALEINNHIESRYCFFFHTCLIWHVFSSGRPAGYMKFLSFPMIDARFRLEPSWYTQKSHAQYDPSVSHLGFSFSTIVCSFSRALSWQLW